MSKNLNIKSYYDDKEAQDTKEYDSEKNLRAKFRRKM